MNDSMSLAEYRILKKGRQKYGNKPVRADGYRFDSVAEHNRYLELLMLLKAGKIAFLEVHPIIDLVVWDWSAEKQTQIGQYTADFRYVDRDEAGNIPVWIYEDVKSCPTAARKDYKLRKALVRALYAIEIREIYA